MCQPKPGNRCHTHARQALKTAQQLHRENPTADTAMQLDVALLEYASTPTGNQWLQRKASDVTLPARMRSRAARMVEEGNLCRQERDEKARIAEWFDIENVDARWRGAEEHQVDISHPQVGKAFAVAVNAHKDVVRKSGEAYINHPLRTAQRLQQAGYNHEVVATALLHDAVEDSALTLDDLKAMNFSPRIITGVDAVTKREGEEYTQAVERAAEHPIGRLVKLSDNLDNSSEEQLKPFDETKRAKQIRKYAPARVRLLNAIDGKPNVFARDALFSVTYRIKHSGSMTSIFA